MKITLRELFLLTVIVALALGWWIDRTRLKNEWERMASQANSFFYASVSLAEMFQENGARFEWSDGDMIVYGPKGGMFATSSHSCLGMIKEEMDQNAGSRR